MAAFLRAATALAACLLLSACLVTPGKFESTLDIRADRSFSFTYKGEILATDMGKGLGSMPSGDDPIDDAAPKEQQSTLRTALQPKEQGKAEERFDGPDSKSGNDKSDEQQMQAIAAALSKEKGFRSARYMGNHKFEIDYAISGKLTHAFLFPFNSDAQIVLPFVAVELRGEDRARMKAPGYSNGYDKSQNPMGGSSSGEDAAKALDGTFTLTTNTEIVSQNQEDGAQNVPQGKRIVWKVTPLTSEAPAATLRFKP
ncbi:MULTISPECIES: hypothetical protein [unclassified Sphingobium]|uniref:hypothetical protein n=1 Tax=unclassified Sphingobium TaxID=2611147 RepID=UPI0007702F40|nr:MULTISPECIES: hypothetical protein [unclassified Sphingobium]AMK24914.1 hypothetical protein K426_19925 [Sphingobium sp. TKS]NML89824.1 hypothetical protein [Sphingobium sp. TB-6]